MKEIDEVIKALRWIASNDEFVFNADIANQAADVIEKLKVNQVVRCKYCKNFEPMNNGDMYGECNEIGIVFEKIGIDAQKHYCSYFEPRRNKHGEINANW